MADALMVKMALIGLLGVGAQWIAWRTGKPAIALMLLAGIIAGPVLGWIVPEHDFGDLQEPIIKLAVAVILFAAGLSLNFRDLRHAGPAVLRLVIIGVPVGAVLGTLASHYAAGLPLGISAVFGGIMVVTGPTVIGPMLRTLRIPPRTRDILKWEGIVNDPIGALLGAAIYAYITYTGVSRDALAIGFDIAAAAALAMGLGVALGFAVTTLFPRGYVPEFLKAPVLLVVVIGGFVLADLIKHETGLITVTVMGVVMANRPMFSTVALRRFKEDLAVLLISGVFIILSATLDYDVLEHFRLRFVLFLVLLLFVIRPVTVLASLIFSKVPWRERLFVAWIAPRGIVAVAVTGLFSLRLADQGFIGARELQSLGFAVVIVTIFAHSLSASWLARRLGIDLGKGQGVLLVGANSWTTAFGAALQQYGLAVTVADTSKFALRGARKRDLTVHRGDVLDEEVQDELDLGQFQQVIAATENDSYNALVCSDLGPELGGERLSQTGHDEERPSHARARVLLASGAPIDELQARIAAGWSFSRTKITEKFGYDQFREQLPEGAEPVAVMDEEKTLLLFSTEARPVIDPGDSVIAFYPPEPPAKAAPKRAEPVAK
ncbi:MAG TPA: sodium:proton antiporter [Sphingomonas sp.]|nr:sodium:proton antiporter [Sphingomonas sp.]